MNSSPVGIGAATSRLFKQIENQSSIDRPRARERTKIVAKRTAKRNSQTHTHTHRERERIKTKRRSQVIVRNAIKNRVDRIDQTRESAGESSLPCNSKHLESEHGVKRRPEGESKKPGESAKIIDVTSIEALITVNHIFMSEKGRLDMCAARREEAAERARELPFRRSDNTHRKHALVVNKTLLFSAAR